MNPLTVAELKLKHAELTHKAERLRQEWRTAVATSPRAAALGRQAKVYQERANDYAEILLLLEPKS